MNRLIEGRPRTTNGRLTVVNLATKTTQIYIHADMRMKEKALSRVAAPATSPGRFRPDDQLLAFLEAL